MRQDKLDNYRSERGALAYQSDHQRKLHRRWSDRRERHIFHRFLGRLAPMGEKLGPVMLQFAYLNKKKMPSLDAFLERLDTFFAAAPEGYRYAVECRNPSYLKQEFFDFLRERRIGFVFLDGYYMPRIGRVFDGADTHTSDFCVMRSNSSCEPMVSSTLSCVPSGRTVMT